MPTPELSELYGQGKGFWDSLEHKSDRRQSSVKPGIRMPGFGLGKYWDTLVLSPDEQVAVITSRGDRRIRGLDWLPVVPSGAGPTNHENIR